MKRAQAKLAEAVRQANEISARHNCIVGVWKDGSDYLVRTNPKADKQAQREGWTLIAIRPAVHAEAA